MTDDEFELFENHDEGQHVQFAVETILGFLEQHSAFVISNALTNICAHAIDRWCPDTGPGLALDNFCSQVRRAHAAITAHNKSKMN